MLRYLRLSIYVWTMPETSNQKEVVRLLVLQHGLQKASELSGVRYDLVRQWSVRGNWNGHAKAVTNVTKAIVDNVQSQLQDHAEQTKLGLSAYARRQAEHLASEGKLSDHGAFRNIASGASTLHGWNAEAKPSHFSLNVLNINTLSVDTDSTLDG